MATKPASIKLDPAMAKPLYLQLAEGILAAWKQGELRAGELLPSLHDFSVSLEVSKNTVEKAYRTLREMDLLSSYKGRGYFLKAPGHSAF